MFRPGSHAGSDDGCDRVKTRCGEPGCAGAARVEEEQMRGSMVVMVAMLIGCSGLVLKKDDSAATKTAKVVTRAALAVPTFGASAGTWSPPGPWPLGPSRQRR